MAEKDSNRLGRGLGAIFGDDVSSVLEDIQQGNNDEFTGVKTSLKVKDIRTNPYQPRRHFDEDKLEELSQSISTHGLFTPILVRETNKGYELVAGERRLRATKRANIEEIAAIVVDFDDSQMMEIAIIENVQREDLNVIEEAMGYSSLIDRLGLTQEEVAKRVSKSRSHITNLLRLLRLPKSVQEMVSDNKLTMGHVRPLVTIEDPKEIERIAEEILSKKLSVREAERLINKEDVKPVEPKLRNKDYDYAQSLFERRLQTRVNIANNKVVISFDDDEDLNRILELLDIIE
ncbi:ParB/RepB/Spo0J family partition protein [Erysipelothrix amsterdamensis]|uniref:ParB/RepB/Spo0J family partition protein n=1 Tax=Erysipelothrix amsterdamensis TaxID=2929157 RepID=A0AAU9VE79_9FIRM|nr:ParB/RepB/Spo0J family partition protein [Erysipelothrix rhusiopathiae]CAH2760624.1 ParB/RepB/Spo0J family partition protein [Erysipelothrix sp. A18Y020d]AGN24968.1 ParB-like partition protein [Erysipelothrix rhusiopathiae SY1027]AMS10304.1 chromosome partitioning protein ParB [Erysipelothrix rhusiopathiae]AOO67354.1 chromosome partitioning protein ParB [Erysipelothrix rhusiopathiae]AWU42332.1 ParB/RepB/Spo0J family partition protein [Erysipelothrix rhusiopathiae]